MATFHVTPNNDLREHVLDPDGACPCLPRRGPDWEGTPRWVHNSYDRREVGEVCRLALDRLGVELANREHEWTPEQRDAYEHAVHLLDMHWPAKPSEPKMHRRL